MLEKRKNCRKFESWRKKNKVYIHYKVEIGKVGEKEEDLIEWFTKHCLKVFT